MKFLIINYRFFVSGGPERYMFNLISLLEKYNHETIHFSIQYTKNKNSKFSTYFVSPLSSPDEVVFTEHSWSLSSLKKTLTRTFYSKEVYSNLTKLIGDFKPDYAIVLHYLRKLSPSVLAALHDNKIDFFVRLSDFAMICPQAHLLRNEKICELCISGNLLYSCKYKCLQNSYITSGINVLATYYHRSKHYFDLVPKFVTPSKFLKQKMIEGGFNNDKIFHLPTFTEKQFDSFFKVSNKKIVYFGRLNFIKGVHVLLYALSKIKTVLLEEHIMVVIIGGSDGDYLENLKKIVAAEGLDNVEFTGELDSEKIDLHLKETLFTVIPSVCYDNMPNTVLESFARGIPVIASRHGSFEEIVLDKLNGFTFNPGDSDDLAIIIKTLIQNPTILLPLSVNARSFIEKNHSPEIHYHNLMNIINSSTC